MKTFLWENFSSQTLWHLYKWSDTIGKYLFERYLFYWTRFVLFKTFVYVLQDRFKSRWFPMASQKTLILFVFYVALASVCKGFTRGVVVFVIVISSLLKRVDSAACYFVTYTMYSLHRCSSVVLLSTLWQTDIVRVRVFFFFFFFKGTPGSIKLVIQNWSTFCK